VRSTHKKQKASFVPGNETRYFFCAGFQLFTLHFSALIRFALFLPSLCPSSVLVRMLFGGDTRADDNNRRRNRPTCRVRVVTFDLDNTVWNTTATIDVANDALAQFLRTRFGASAAVRVETVMGTLYRADQARYAPIEKERAKSPVLLTLLRKDAIRHVLEVEYGVNVDDNHGDDDVRSSVVDDAFDAWMKARYEAIPNHLADSVLQCLQELKDQNLVIGAITDGNSDPLRIPELADFFDFCINAEMVGVSKPDPRLYLRAIEHALNNHPSLEDLRVKATNPDALQDSVGPWWVHIGDDFVKDIVAAKNLNMRSIWCRELVLDKLTKPNSGEAVLAESSRQKSVEDLVQQISELKVIEMQVGADTYLADSLQEEFADAITDDFKSIAAIVKAWQDDSSTDSLALATGDYGQEEIVVGSSTSATVAPSDASSDSNTAASTKFCIYCGGKLPAVAKFCSTCGEKQ
jgi:FMN hydrolase / 5-amino-6-(5-phospho-D-ribitylamino)uracil phosphatase